MIFRPTFTGILLLLLGVGCVDPAPSQFTRSQGALDDGNHRFVTQHMTHPRSGQARRSETASNGQHPFAAIVCCSDSRCPPELIFDQGLGDLFVVRIAGNTCDDGEIGSIEYAVAHLHIPLVVVLGHTQCGAVAAAVDGERPPGPLGIVVDRIRPAVEAASARSAGMSRDALLTASIRENVRRGVAAMKTHSEIVREASVIGAVYDIASGKIEWLEPDGR